MIGAAHLFAFLMLGAGAVPSPVTAEASARQVEIWDCINDTGVGTTRWRIGPGVWQPWSQSRNVWSTNFCDEGVCDTEGDEVSITIMRPPAISTTITLDKSTGRFRQATTIDGRSSIANGSCTRT